MASKAKKAAPAAKKAAPAKSAAPRKSAAAPKAKKLSVEDRLAALEAAALSHGWHLPDVAAAAAVDANS